MHKISSLAFLTICLFSGAVMADSEPVCREFTRDIKVGGKTQQAYGTACRQEDGSWKMQPEPSASVEPVSDRVVIIERDRGHDRWDDGYDDYRREYPPHRPFGFFSLALGDFDHGYDRRYRQNHWHRRGNPHWNRGFHRGHRGHHGQCHH